MSTLKMWDLAPSPNSKKVRIALNYKGIDFERIAVDPMDRSNLVELSGQPLSPVIQHGDTVLYDSNAIMRYLDANVKREPRIYAEDYDAMKQIERWETFGRQEMGSQIARVFGQAQSDSPDMDAVREAAAEFNAKAEELETALNEDHVLVGDALTAADIACASYLSVSLITPEGAASWPIAGFFFEHLKLSQERERLRKWYRNVNQHDR